MICYDDGNIGVLVLTRIARIIHKIRFKMLSMVRSKIRSRIVSKVI